MEKKRIEMREEFLKLTPLQRIRKLNAVFNDMIAIKTKNGGVPEYEVYRRYLTLVNRIVRDVAKSIDVDIALIGRYAVIAHGVGRTTMDVDILIYSSGIKNLQRCLKPGKWSCPNRNRKINCSKTGQIQGP